MGYLKAEHPVEVRTPWFHAEFFLQAGVVRFRGLKPSVLGTNLVPGGIKFTLNLKKLGPYAKFWESMALILERHRPR